LLQNRNRFCVPNYQRHYVWTKEKQWEPFWNDIRTKAIERLAGRERRFSHFMGAVVLEARGGFSARRVPSFQVVDGQQRLTTFQLFLAATPLTLLTQPLNSSVSNGPYAGKREALQRHSLLVLNREITESQSWDEATILARSKALLPLALGIWRLPETQQQRVMA